MAPARSGLGLALGVVCFLLFSATALYAQTDGQRVAAADSITPLQIGDAIPEALWRLPLQVVNHPEGRDTITLDDYRNKKLIILDFWATWCAPCVGSLIKLDTLQGLFATDLAVIPATYEERDKAEAFFRKRGWSLPTAVSESRLRHFFPYRSIPHQVWIGNGRVIGKPIPHYLTKANIAEAIAGRDPQLVNQTESDDTPPVDTLFTAVLTKRNGAVAGGVKRNTGAITVNNATAAALFLEAYRDVVPFHASRNRLVLDVGKALSEELTLSDFELVGDRGHDLDMMALLEEFTYCYHLRYPAAAGAAEVRAFMQRNLNDLFRLHLGIEAGIESRMMDCLVLKTVGDTLRVLTGGGKPTASFEDEHYLLENHPVSRLVTNLAYANMHLPTPIVDGTGITGHIDISLRSGLQDIAALNRELEAYGLRLVEERRALPVLVISGLKGGRPTTNLN